MKINHRYQYQEVAKRKKKDYPTRHYEKREGFISWQGGKRSPSSRFRCYYFKKRNNYRERGTNLKITKILETHLSSKQWAKWQPSINSMRVKIKHFLPRPSIHELKAFSTNYITTTLSDSYWFTIYNNNQVRSSF